MTPIATRPWAEFEEEWRGWVSGWVAVGEASEAPQTWKDLVERLDAESIDAIWGDVDVPSFRRYLKRALIDARIARSSVGLMLVYHVASWEEQGVEGYLEGFIIAGLPAAENHIDLVEQSVGQLPDVLKQTWRAHSFIQLRDTSFLVSPNPAHHELTTAPVFMGIRQHDSKPDVSLECLGIAGCAGSLVLSMTRPPGAKKWNDRLVLAEHWGPKMGEASPTTFDELLFGRDYWLTDLLG